MFCIVAEAAYRNMRGVNSCVTTHNGKPLRFESFEHAKTDAFQAIMELMIITQMTEKTNILILSPKFMIPS